MAANGRGESAAGESGARALALAGRALDPNAPGGPDWSLGQLLLREAFLRAARALSGRASLDSIEAAADAILPQGDPTTLAARRENILVALGRTAAPDGEALTRAEMDVARVVDDATKSPHTARAIRVGRWVAVSLAVALITLALIVAHTLQKPWEAYTWSASSALSPYPQYGTLGEHGAHDIVFHTKLEADPWVVVDLGSVRTVSSVVLRNRQDCCRQRGLPLIVELAGADRSFTAVGTRTELFDVWRLSFPSQKARYLRLRATGTTILHLTDVQIR